jgi:hypothetical protein
MIYQNNLYSLPVVPQPSLDQRGKTLVCFCSVLPAFGMFVFHAFQKGIVGMKLFLKCLVTAPFGSRCVFLVH